MTKKAKKGPPPKRGPKGSGKPTKKPTQPEGDINPEEPSTSAQKHEESPAQAAGPSSAATIIQIRSSTSKNPGTIIKKCEQLEKLASSMQEKCKVSSQESAAAKTPQNSVQELEFLVSEIKKLAHNVTFDMAEPPPLPPRPKELTDPIVFHDEYQIKWHKTKMRVPFVYLHPTTDILLPKDIVSQNIKINWMEIRSHFSKISCPTFEDHEKLVKYFDEREMPYHTFGHPPNKMIKVVIRGICNNIDLNKVKEEMVAALIPVVRFNAMNPKLDRKCKYQTMLVVVPDTEEGRKVLKVKTIYGQYVKVEAPKVKAKQCFRCQKWGHSQRYCRGRVKCVKCAEEHLYNKCTRDPANDPLKCANCGGEHTASYRKCTYCPESDEYKEAQRKRVRTTKPVQ